MRDYELMVIVSPNIESEGVTNVVDRVTQLIGNGGGEVTSIDVWGKRTLAYPIDNYREGVYVLLNVKLPAAALTELERELKLAEHIVRHMIIKVES